MTDHREVMRQALNALIWEVGSEPAMYSAQTRAAIKALRAAIDEPVPEPVAWIYRHKMGQNPPIWSITMHKGSADPVKANPDFEVVPLYAHPSAADVDVSNQYAINEPSPVGSGNLGGRSATTDALISTEPT